MCTNTLSDSIHLHVCVYICVCVHVNITCVVLFASVLGCRCSITSDLLSSRGLIHSTVDCFIFPNLFSHLNTDLIFIQQFVISHNLMIL